MTPVAPDSDQRVGPRGTARVAGGIAATRAVVTVHDTVVVRTYSHIVGLIGEARLPDRVATRALETFGALAEVEVAPPPPPGRADPLPRGRRPRHHRRRGRDCGCARGARHRRGPLQPGRDRARNGEGGPRIAAESRTCGRRTARRGSHLGTEHRSRADDADRRRADLLTQLGLRPDAADAGERPGVRCRCPRARRAAELHAGGDRGA